MQKNRLSISSCPLVINLIVWKYKEVWLRVDQCSLYSVFIEVCTDNKTCPSEEIILSKASGFIYKYSSKTYLVSNWHVFSGRNAMSCKPLDKNCALPSKIKVHFPVEGDLGNKIVVEYQLKDELLGKFNWLEHDKGNLVDVALLEIEVDDEYGIYPINEINESKNINGFPDGFYVGQEVFILGFPLGVMGGGGLPVWKKASIAVEPYLSIDDSNLKMLVDTASRKGMSGAPVIFASVPNANVLYDGRKQPIDIRASRLFLGVYSGRICGGDEFAAQLGVVWKEQSIREIIEQGAKYQEIA